jgi:hypothetical protein
MSDHDPNDRKGPQFAELRRTGPEKWVPAEAELPDEAQQWLDVLCTARERLGGDIADLRQRIRFQLDLSSTPRVVRVLFEGKVLEYVPPFFEGMPFVDVILESAGPEVCHYEPMASHYPQFTDELLDRYARRFVTEAGFPAHRIDDAKQTLELMVTTDTERPVIRATSHFTGETQWFQDWDGTLEHALSLIEEVADQNASWVDTEREYGLTEWDEPRPV